MKSFLFVFYDILYQGRGIVVSRGIGMWKLNSGIHFM